MVIGSRLIAEVQPNGYTLLVRLADLIATERRKRGWSKSELARQARVDPSTISRLEKGQFLGRSDTIARIGSALGIDPRKLDAVLREEEEEQEIQAINLSKVPPERRPFVRRMIEAVVREAEQNQ